MKTRIGIIGLGMASAPHAKSLLDLSDRVEVAAAFSPSAARRQAFAATYGFPVCDSAEAIFSDPSIGAVLLLTPPNTHLDLVGGRRKPASISCWKSRWRSASNGPRNSSPWPRTPA